MTVFRRNLQRAIVFTIILLVASGISGVLYYLKMEHNEATFNRLQLQELMRIEQSIAQTISRVKTTADFLSKHESCTSKANENKCNSTIEARLDHIKNPQELRSLSIAEFSFIRESDALDIEDKDNICRRTAESGKPDLQLSLRKETLFTVVRPNQKYDDTEEACFKLDIQLQTKHLLLSAENRFSHTFITTSEGNVIAQHQNLRNDVSLPSLIIEKIRYPNDEELYDTAGSKIVDTQINNTDVRFYITPLLNDIDTPKNGTFYLVGIIPNSVIVNTKLQISSKSFMWLIIGVLFFISLTPLLKLRFVNPRYSISRNDKSQIALGLIMATAIATIALNQQLFYLYLNDFKENQTEHLFENIQKKFSTELREASATLDDLTDDFAMTRDKDMSEIIRHIAQHHETEKAEALVEELIRCELHNSNSNVENAFLDPQNSDSCSVYRNLVNFKGLQIHSPDRKYQSFFEMVGILNNEAELSNEFAVFYATDGLFIELSEPLNLSKREYVQAALNDGFWTLKEPLNLVEKISDNTSDETGNETSSETDFYLQRIHNIEDARKVSMLVKPFSDRKEDPNAVAKIASLKFNSLLNVNLPMGFSFAVLDKAGNAVFHHQDELSLVENFVYETNNNQELIAALLSANARSKSHKLKFDYKGVEHSAIIGSLTDSDSTLPWQLIVFYDESEIALNNMLLVFVALILVVAILLPIFIVIRYFSHQRFFVDLLYFNSDRVVDYVKWSWLIIAVYIAIVYSQGIVTELSSRLIIWLLFCLAIISALHRRISTCEAQVHWSKSPQACVVFFLVVLIAIGTVLSVSIDVPFIIDNWIFLVIGVLLVIVALAATARLQKGNDNLNDSSIKRFNNGKRYIDANRFSAGYVMFITVLVLTVASMPAVMIAQSTNAYLLQRQGDLQTSHATATERQLNHRYNDYVNKLFGPISPSRPSPATVVSLHDILSEYLDPKYVRAYNKCEQNTDENKRINPFSQKWIDLSNVSAISSIDENLDCETTNDVEDDNSDDEPALVSLTDTVIDHLFALAEFQNAYGTQLSMFAKQQLNLAPEKRTSHKKDRPIFRPDSFMIAASFEYAGFLWLCLFIFYFTTQWVVKRFIVMRLMGEHLLDHTQFSVSFKKSGVAKNGFRALAYTKKEDGNKALVLLNTSKLTFYKVCGKLRISLYKERCLNISNCLEQFGQLSVLQKEIRENIALSDDKTAYIALEGFEEISQDDEKRHLAIVLIRELLDMKGIVILIVASASPFYRLINNDAYATLPNSDIQTNRDEISAWTNVFEEFDKAYLWFPLNKSKPADPLNLISVIKHETSGWPELKNIRQKLISHEDWTSIKEERDADHDALKTISEPEQVIACFLAHANSFYRKQWELCTRDEKIALWQIANGASINPANVNVIEHLSRRGYIFRHQGWHIINESFKKFVLSAEPEQHIEQWLQQNNEGLWQVLRIPIFVIFIVVVVVMYYSSGESLTSFITIATGTLGLIPLVLRNINLVKSNGIPESD